MNKINLRLIISIVAISLYNCTNNQDMGNSDGYIYINPLKSTTNTNNLATYIDQIELVDIDDSKIDISTTKKAIFMDDSNFILLLSSKVSMFDRNGNHITDFGSIGRGPGEFLKIYDISLNNDGTELWVLNQMGEVLKYDLASGNYIRKIRYENKKINSTEAICPISNDNLLILSTNEIGAKKINYDYPFISEYNHKGQFVKKIASWRDFNIDYPFGPFISYSMGKYIIRPQENENICYCVENGEISELYKIHFEEQNIEPLFAFGNQADPWSKLTDILNSNSFKSVMNIQLTNKYLHFSAIGPNYTLVSFLISNDTKKGIYWTHKTKSARPFFFVGSDSEFFYGIYTNESKDITNEQSPMLSYLSERYDIQEGETCLIKIKFK